MPDIVKPPFRFWSFTVSLKGRITRAAFSRFALPVLLSEAGFLICYIIFRLPNMDDPHYAAWLPVTMTFGALAFILWWPIFATTVKRLHDIGCNFTPALIYFARPAVTTIVNLPYIISYATHHRGLHPVQWPFWISGIELGICLLLTIGLCLWPSQRRANRFGPPIIGSDTIPAEHF